jgi:hypothetical protein
MNCYGDTNKHPRSPGKEDMLANNAQVLKDVSASLAWNCLHRVANREFGLADGEVAATPTELADPLARL